tara:strand:+ start:11 stop:1960 length:1950 start_codon:yes stop_codon:yes gene_type:complete
MATHDYVIDNGTGSAVRADLNSLFKAILTNNSGTTDPSTVISSDAGSKAFSFWADTNSSPAVLKIRNAADDGWIELFQLDGTLTLEDGSASTPGLAFRDDLNTGIFSSAADTFNVATGGVERMELGATTIFNEDGADVDFRIEGDTEANLFYVDAGNDRIGIGGTTTPDTILEITDGGTEPRLVRIHNSSTNGSAIQFTNTDTGNSTNQGLYVGLDASGHGNFYHQSNFHLIFATNNSEGMRLDTSGRLLIGTTTEGNGNADDLTIGTSADTGMTIRSGTSHAGSIFFSDATSGNAEFAGFIQYLHNNNSLSFGTDETSRMTIDNSGRLLIGSTVNVSNGGIEGALQVIGTGSDDASMNLARFSNDVNESFLCFSKSRGGSIAGNTVVQSGDRLGSIFFFGNDGTDSNSIAASIRCEVDGTPGANDMPGRLRFATTPDGSETALTRMTIQNDGDVLIGTTSGVQNGRLEVRSDKTSASTVTFANTNASYVGTVMLLHAERETVNNSYEFIGCRIESPNPGVQAFRLEVGDDGDVRNVNGSYGTISDISLKENIVDANSQWDDFKNLKFRSYNYKESTGFPTHKQIGVVAQEAETVCPNLVQTGREDENTKETHKFVKTSILYMKGMKALQEAIAKIEVLETKVAALEAA